MFDFSMFHLTGYIQTIILIAAMFNVSKTRWTPKQAFWATGIIYIPFTVMVAFFNINLLNVYAWVLFAILAIRVAFRLSWRQSIFIGVFINFINVVMEYVIILIISLLPETAQTLILDNLYIPRTIVIACCALLYIFSTRFKYSEHPPLAHFASIHWILYFLAFGFFGDFNLAQFYDTQPTIYNTPGIIIVVLFLIFFLYNLLYLNSLNDHIVKKLEAEHKLELTEKELEIRHVRADALQKELEVMELYNATLKDVLDELQGFRHEFSNLVNSINGYVHREDLTGLEIHMKRFTTTTITSATLEIVENLKHFPILFGLLISKISYAKKREVEFLVTIMCTKPDIKYCSVVDYGLIVGILLDNALESAEESKDKIMQFDIIVKRGRLSTTVINSCDEPVDIDRIFERGYSTKFTPSGEGLYHVDRILQKYNENDYDMQLITTLENGMFMQELII